MNSYLNLPIYLSFSHIIFLFICILFALSAEGTYNILLDSAATLIYPLEYVVYQMLYNLHNR